MLTESLSPEAANALQSQILAEQKKKGWYQDTAIVRYRGSPEVRVLNQNEFGAELARRPNEEYWKRVEVIQTCVKAKIGCGEPILIHFLAPLDQSNPDKEIDFDYKSLPSDYELYASGND